MNSLDSSILPPNATEFELSLESLTKKATNLPVEVDKLLRGDICPIGLLPWLAWAMSVDTWNDDWSDATKRKVVSNSIAVHRKKGTRYAVDKALDNLNVSADIVEWWQTDPQGERGTFAIKADVGAMWQNEVVFNKDLKNQVLAAVDSSKPLSRPYDFSLMAKTGSLMDVAVGIVARQVLRITGIVAKPQIISHGALAGALKGKMVLRLTGIGV